MSATPSQPAVSGSGSAEPMAASGAGLMEIGWLVCENLDPIDRQAIELACQRTTDFLREKLPDFQWRIVVEIRESPFVATQSEPTEYLQWARSQRDLGGWDYVFVFVRPDLEARQKSQAWACVSRSLDSAVISTARIDPRAEEAHLEETGDASDQRVARLAQRISTLALRSLGHLSGLPRVADPTNIMSQFDDLSELDLATELTARQIDDLQENLAEVADLRLEEEVPEARLPWWSFYPQAAWRNRREIFHGLRQARPWQMPIRMARLTIAALSTMLVLTMSAEAWELGTHQTALRVLLLSLVAIVATVAYVLHRQRLLLSPRRTGWSEQIVTTNLTTVAIIGVGILTTYVCLFLLTLALSLLLFDAPLIKSWAATLPGEVVWEHYFNFAGFVSSAGIIIGAMGASFEGEHYFRHITYVDEEV